MLSIEWQKQITLWYAIREYKKGTTFKIGVKLLKDFPELEIIKGVSYRWSDFRYDPRSFKTYKIEDE